MFKMYKKKETDQTEFLGEKENRQRKFCRGLQGYNFFLRKAIERK